MPKLMVKCTDNDDCAILTVGKVYEVTREFISPMGNPCYTLIGFPEGEFFFSRRFEVVPEEPRKPATPIDMSDWRTWRDFGRKQDECACGDGQLRATCRWHKDQA